MLYVSWVNSSKYSYSPNQTPNTFYVAVSNFNNRSIIHVSTCVSWFSRWRVSTVVLAGNSTVVLAGNTTVVLARQSTVVLRH